MFGDIFDTTQQLLTGEKQGSVQTSWQRKPKSCADQLPLPDKQRRKGFPVGLKNQGCTCYLNSLLQVLYFTPEFRDILLKLSLCKEDLQTKTDFVDGQKKHKFLMGFQRLFSEMMLRDVNSVGTEYLNAAFGWQEDQHNVQQDIQQAMRVIFDYIQRALFGTQYQQTVSKAFKGVSSSYKSCKNCTVRSDRYEDFFDLMVQVKNINSLGNSLLNFLTPQSMDGDNKVFCEVCQSKQDAWLGRSIKKLPDTLIFSLNRFQFDYQKLDRVKVNSYFEFDLQINLDFLITQQDKKTQKECQQFQLYGVLIHRGSAHGGHYLCYIRDIMKQSQWQKGIEQVKMEQKKRSEQWQANKAQLTQQQIKKREELQKQNKLHELKQPGNQKLMENWFEINDAAVKALDPHKITSKYEGSESAYILFYRRKSTPLPQKIQIPPYFYKPIAKQNQLLKQQREKYQIQKHHIILKINDEPIKLKKSTKISQLKQKFCPFGTTLVNEDQHQGLPYFPMQLNSLMQSRDEDTIQSLELIHQSVWRTYLIESQEYGRIQKYIGPQKLPFVVTLMYTNEENQNKNQKLTLYQDQILGDLRKRLEKQFKVPYETQIIKLVTPYNETFLTDDLSNDSITLPKLRFVNEAQLILKSLNPKQKVTKNKQENSQQQNSDLICFIIQRDDQIGIKRLYFDKHSTLDDLLKHVMKVENMQITQKRRFRNLDGNRLYYIDHYCQQLQKLNLGDDMVKFRIQKGEIPIKGDICIKFKMQSQYQNPDTPQIFQFVCDPNTIIKQLKQLVCQKHGLDPLIHKLYMTDWMQQPNQHISKEHYSLFELSFSREQTFCLRDNLSPIASQLLHFEVTITESGSPESLLSNKESFFVKTQQNKTLLQFKQQLLQTEKLKGKNLKAKQLRLRQIRRDYMFGSIWRHHEKQLKTLDINNNKLALQIMSQEEDLSDDTIVLMLKKRNLQKRIYDKGLQLIFEAGKGPVVEDLNKAIKKRLEIAQESEIKAIKYVVNNFQWVQVTKNTIETFIRERVHKKGNKVTQDKNQEKGKQVNHGKKNQPKKPKQNNNKKDEVQQKKNEQQPKIDKPNKQKQKVKNEKNEKKNKQSKQQQSKGGITKPNKENKPKQKFKQQDCFNIRKAPIFLKDGDWIGYGLVAQLQGDDLQTDQDLTLRALKDEQKMKPGKKPARRNEGKGFQIKMDF